MENMENNVVATENAAAEAATGATFGQKALGVFVGACTVVGAVTIVKKITSGVKNLIGELFKPKTDEQEQGTTESTDSTDGTK